MQGRIKFFAGGALIVVAIIYLIISSTQANAQYFLTVRELIDRKTEMMGREVRISGAVLGDTIQYEAQTLKLSFSIVHVSGNNNEIEAQGGIAEALHQATLDPSLPRLAVVYNGPRPDLLKNEAQAIITGTFGKDDVFIAKELLLKCPTRYEEAVPTQVEKK